MLCKVAAEQKVLAKMMSTMMTMYLQVRAKNSEQAVQCKHKARGAMR